jgi:hypothetical protein
MKRLRLIRETLAELTGDELAGIAAGMQQPTPPTPVVHTLPVDRCITVAVAATITACVAKTLNCSLLPTCYCTPMP